jgi:hypothetical protein
MMVIIIVDGRCKDTLAGDRKKEKFVLSCTFADKTPDKTPSPAR